MTADTKYFKDTDSQKVILVRKRKDIFELEYITRDNHNWQKTCANHSYEREFYLGQGNGCLLQITTEEAIRIMEGYGVNHGCKPSRVNITLTNGADAEDIADAVSVFLKNKK